MIDPTFTTPHVTLYTGDALAVLRDMPADSVDCVVTSPPYWGLRDYGMPGQLGLEKTPEEYVVAIVAVLAEVRRVLRPAGTLWLNLGDSYGRGTRVDNVNDGLRGTSPMTNLVTRASAAEQYPSARRGFVGNKQLVGIPWRVAFALQADGWWLRSDIVWSKPNPMPESVTDRPTKSHEYVFLLSKSLRYFYDAAAIRLPMAESSIERLSQPNLALQHGSDRVPGKTNGPMKAVGHVTSHMADTQRNDGDRWRLGGSGGIAPRRTDKQRGHGRRHDGFNDRWDQMERDEQIAGGANARTVWEIATQPYPDAHFATFPREIPERCIKAGCPEGGTVLDPFAGSGTTLAVARDLGRKSIGIELNPAYVGLIEARCAQLALEMGA